MKATKLRASLALLLLGTPLLLTAPAAEAVVTHYPGAICEAQSSTYEEERSYDSGQFWTGSAVSRDSLNLHVICPLNKHSGYSNIERATVLVEDVQGLNDSVPFDCTLFVEHQNGTQLDSDGAAAPGNGDAAGVYTLTMEEMLPGNRYFMRCTIPRTLDYPNDASRLVGISVEEER
jgi:hypothetical protein